MAVTKTHSLFWLLGRSLMPSTTSAIACVTAGILLTTFGVVMSSVNYGTLLPNIFDGYSATQYTNNVVQPITAVVSSQAWNGTLVIAMWSFFGLILYSLIAASIKLYQDWRNAAHNVQIMSDNVLVRHPLEKSFLLQGIWRLAIGMLIAVALVLIQGLAQRTLTTLHQLIIDTTALAAFKQIGSLLVMWIFASHSIVVLLRLYTLRTRLFGDLLY